MGEFNVETMNCDDSETKDRDFSFSGSIFKFHISNSSISLNEFIKWLVRKKLSKSVKYGIEIFLCDICGDVMTEPVTLKCGHTFSKKCVLDGNGSFECKVCGHIHKDSLLKTNVIIASIVDKFWRFLENIKYEATKKDCDENFYSSTHSQTQEMFSGTAYRTTPKYIQSIWMQSSKKPKLEALKSYAFEVTSPQFTKYSNKNEMDEVSCSIVDAASGKLHLKHCDLWWNSIKREDNFLKGILSAYIRNIEKFIDFISLVCEEFQCDLYEFECPLCLRILWEPCTTPCGHTFCTSCLKRSLDHQPKCPLCKASLENVLTERCFETTIFIEKAIRHLLPNHYIERKLYYKEEINEFQNTVGGEHFIPLFVCTNAYPTVPCPLHIFEPRYRLMIRRCLESGHRCFGMCSYVNNEIAEYGTMLEIRDVHYFPDGRSIIDTVGSKRFRILSKRVKDGYHTAAVEFLEDQKVTFDNLVDLKMMQEQAYRISCDWFRRLSEKTRQQILQYYGPMPEIDENSISTRDGPSWFWWTLAVMPFEPEVQVMLLGMCSLYLRLLTLHRILLHMLPSEGIKNIVETK